MPPPKKRKAAATTTTSAKKGSTNDAMATTIVGSSVYVVTLVEEYHGGGDVMEPKLVGVYDSKVAAAAHAGSVSTIYGSFDSAIESDYSDDYEDYRENVPDSGVLLQIGNEDYGNTARLVITKTSIIGMP